jgi:N-acetyl-1-D-myo-inositol-2-amino-2-deoxy-alpha-D-glucopyranoside deacetylase
MRAVELATWPVAKVYWNTMPRSVMEGAVKAMADNGTPFDDWGPLEDLPFLKPDEVVTTAIHAPEQVERKVAALRAHATQITVDGPIFALSNNLGQGVFGSEYYTLVHGTLGPDRGPDGWESDLFSGIEIT